MRTVYVGLACGLIVAIGAAGAVYYSRNGAPAVTNSIAPAPHAPNHTFIVPRPSVHTVAWYQAHPDQAKEKLATCNNSPGTAINDPECRNAATAKENNDLDNFIKSAPNDAQPLARGH
jgi:hypothetical protein